MSVRRYASLVKWLPPDAALWRATGKDWSTTNELLSILIETLDTFRRMYLQANSKRGTNLPEPLHIPRPWEREKERKKSSGTSLRELIGVHRVPVKTGGK